jgi:hypothetical protein
VVAPIDALDFWLGSWEVRGPDGSPAGTNVVERVLDGHAVIEYWRAVDGAEEKSLFYYEPSAGTWRQVWVTSGCVKEKALVAAGPDGVRFEGHALVAGRRHPDRTTLTVLPGGQVGQLIEDSLDDGTTWIVSFDAVYTRV